MLCHEAPDGQWKWDLASAHANDHDNDEPVATTLSEVQAQEEEARRSFGRAKLFVLERVGSSICADDLAESLGGGIDKQIAERILAMLEKDRLISSWSRRSNSRRVLDPNKETGADTCGNLSEAESTRSKRHRIAGPHAQQGSQQGSETQPESEPPRKPRKVSHAKRPIKSAGAAPAAAAPAPLAPWPAPSSGRSKW